MNYNNENLEEVPLDLFNQVSLNDYEPIEVIDLSAKENDNSSQQVVISIPLNAYKTAIQKEKNESQNNVTPSN